MPKPDNVVYNATNIVDYMVSEESSYIKITSLVQSYIEQGWQPYSHLQLIASSNGYKYVQTMVKYGEN